MEKGNWAIWERWFKWTCGWALITMLMAGTAMAEITSFKHWEGYNNAAVEILSDAPTTSTIQLCTIPDRAILQTQSVDTPTTSVSVEFSNLYPGTLYGIIITVPETEYDTAYTPDKTGYLLQTLDRWHFFKRESKLSGDEFMAQINEVVSAIDEVAPDKALDVLDNLEKRARDRYIKAIQDKRTEEENRLEEIGNMVAKEIAVPE